MVLVLGHFSTGSPIIALRLFASQVADTASACRCPPQERDARALSLARSLSFSVCLSHSLSLSLSRALSLSLPPSLPPSIDLSLSPPPPSQAAADQKGVMLLSGYSPALMKFILSGEMEEERITIDADGRVVKTRSLLDPRLTLHRVLHDSGNTLSLSLSLSPSRPLSHPSHSSPCPPRLGQDSLSLSLSLSRSRSLALS